jgi:hypothetical protein
LEWNGNEVAAADLASTWTGVAFEIDGRQLHTNELVVKRAGGTQGRVDVADITVELR